MGALTLPCSSIDELLNSQSAALQQWFSSGGHKIDGLLVRKCPSWLEPEQFIKANADVRFDTACFRLMMCSKRDIWRVSVEMVFHTESRVMDDGTKVGPGILFCVLNDEGKSISVDYFVVSIPPSAESITSEQWCSYWFGKLAKSHYLNRIFAYKEFEAEID